MSTSNYNHSEKAASKHVKSYHTYDRAEKAILEQIEKAGLSGVRYCIVALPNGRFLPAALGQQGNFLVHSGTYWMG